MWLSSDEPVPAPTITGRSLPRTWSSGSAASASASCVAQSAISAPALEDLTIRRSASGQSGGVAGAPDTWDAKPRSAKSALNVTPERPARSAAAFTSSPAPKDDNAPIPVTTTRRCAIPLPSLAGIDVHDSGKEGRRRAGGVAELDRPRRSP